MKASFDGIRKRLVCDFNVYAMERDDETLDKIRDDIVALCCMYDDEVEGDCNCIIDDVALVEVIDE